MVDVTAKDITRRQARAAGSIFMEPETLALIESGGVKKGDVLSVARIAGIMAAKKTHEYRCWGERAIGVCAKQPQGGGASSR